MQIFGKEIGFLRTVAANCKIADMCPDGDISNASELFEGSYQKSQNMAAKFISYMNEGYEMYRKFSEAGYEAKVITPEELLYLPDDLFQQAFEEALKAYSGEKPTIETVPEKGKKKATVKSS